jgi:hypothetical protein
MGSARRLAQGGTASPEFVRKVARYFPRHAGDLKATGADPGDKGYPSNGRIAWNLWGGTPGWVWARSKVRQLDNCTRKFDDEMDLEKEIACSCGCGTCNDDIIKEFTDMEDMLEQVLNEEGTTLEDIEKSLHNDENYAKVSEMDTTAEDKLSLLKRFVNWLTVEEETVVEKSVEIEEASTETEVEVDNDQMEDQMDIEILKDALGSVFDQKLTDFATSFKEEVEASIDSKIEEVTKSADVQREELEQKLASAEQALAEQTEKVEAFAAAGAVKKSVDPDDDEDGEDELTKSAPQSFWNNIYLPSELVKALGYES